MLYLFIFLLQSVPHALAVKIGAEKLYTTDYRSTKYCGNYNTGPLFGAEYLHYLKGKTSFLFSMFYTSNTYNDTLKTNDQNIYIPVTMALLYAIHIKGVKEFIPFITAGSGAYYWKYRHCEENIAKDLSAGVNGGLGMEYPLQKNTSIILSLSVHYIFNKNINKFHFRRGHFNDYFAILGISARYYF